MTYNVKNVYRLQESMRNSNIGVIILPLGINFRWIFQIMEEPSERLVIGIIGAEGVPKLIVPNFEVDRMKKLTGISECVGWDETEDPYSNLNDLIPDEFGNDFDTRFAVIGDYGSGSQAEADVAALVKSWNPDLIITTGDNNYPDGAADTIDDNIGQFFHEFIFPYTGNYGQGAQENRFFPSLGNHDWYSLRGAQPYLEYFSLPGNERYYEFTRGPVHFYALDSDSREPDGVGRSSQQAAWLQNRLAGSIGGSRRLTLKKRWRKESLTESEDWR